MVSGSHGNDRHAAAPGASAHRGPLHAIALFEAAKGMAAVAAGIGLLSLAHRDVRALAYALIGHFHLDPDARYPRILLQDAAWLADANQRQEVLQAWGYASLRMIEAYGLWWDKWWAEWLAAMSGGLYLPIEVDHLLAHATPINAGVLALDAAVMVYMMHRLGQRRRAPRPHGRGHVAVRKQG